MTLSWNEQYSVDLPELDEEHKALFAAIARFGMLLLEGASVDTLRADLRAFYDILIAHINHEELLMFQEGCPHHVLQEHAKDHQDFLVQLRTAYQELSTIEEFKAFLRYTTFWLRLHVLTVDRPCCHQILAMRQGISARKAYQQSANVAVEAMPTLLEGMKKTYITLYDSQLQLVHQNIRLKEVQDSLSLANQALEHRVAERTVELTEANNRLREEFLKLQQLNQQLESTQNQLLQADKMAAIGQLAAGVAHEINNPIGFVNANLSTLRSYIHTLLGLITTFEQVADELPEAVRQRLESYKQSIELEYVRQDIVDLLDESSEGLDRVKQIVQDLKDFARAGEAVWQEADLHKGLNSTLNVVWNELKYKATVVKEYGELPLVRCVPSQINQVFMNVLVNAAHAIEGSGTITLTTGCDGEQVWIRISDSGKGMSEEVRQRIFDPFFTTKPVGQGTGLGLSLAYSIMQKHQGRIDVESTVGVGTHFTLWLPIRGPANEVP
jgi:hemerythrin-like metal-binding domain